MRKVHRAHKDNKDNKVFKDHKDHKVKLVLRGQLALVLQALKGYKVLKV